MRWPTGRPIPDRARRSPSPAARSVAAARGLREYDINGRDGLRVAEGATLDVAMPVYRYEPGSEATGQRPAPALLAPVYQENPLCALTQRAGVT